MNTSKNNKIKYKNESKNIMFPKKDIKRYKVKGGSMKSFTLYLRDLFEALNIEHNTYYSSSEIQIENKSYVIFQHKAKNNKHLWFHFSTLFKSRNFKTFLRKIKKFFTEELGLIVKNAFDIAINTLATKYRDLLETPGEEKGTKYHVSMKVTPKEVLMFFHNIHFRFVPNSNTIVVNVLKDLYRRSEERLLEFIMTVVKNIESIFLTHKDLIINVRKRPFLPAFC